MSLYISCRLARLAFSLGLSVLNIFFSFFMSNYHPPVLFSMVLFFVNLRFNYNSSLKILPNISSFPDGELLNNLEIYEPNTHR